MTTISIIELLADIEQRPAMYLGKKSLSLLAAFLQGVYTFGDCISDAEIFREFQPWIQKIYKIESSQHWSNIILFYQSDEQYAMDDFFRLFHQFLSEKKIR